VSPAQKLEAPVVATTVPPERTSRVVAKSGRSYSAMLRVTFAGEVPVFVPEAYTVHPETSSAVSPAGTFWTVSTLLRVS
jgi:hypothetical protein